ncbi:DUF4065 domain-containing protein [Sandaracinobacter neustonicus]|uniref:DUF4065 domain-containing protein n=1 Tax=Sandaracinobacter neustonicus TaxID=1715348 RepID=A0A501XRQ3_9SPHN|nr:type II toxin-antitoxin system antitoxin SocA domain-containing protein [Sandaracinobacter neustonicus]TPE62894.1 DUF4065 domain-containing protein [Sandaracinobacter neustonicus]
MSRYSSSGAYSVRVLANWILDYAESEGHTVSNMALNKLVYFAYECALVKYNRKLTNAKIEAWDHGPVFREIYHDFKKFGSTPINDRAKIYDPVSDTVKIANAEIDPHDEGIIAEAIRGLLQLPASTLREISHAQGGPWDLTWNHAGDVNPGMQISDDLIVKCHIAGVKM